jgi:putative transposase
VCTDFEVVLKEFNGEPDHVHLLVNYPPKVRLSGPVPFGLRFATRHRCRAA